VPWVVNPSVHEPINASTHQPINPSTHQPINPSTHGPINPSAHQPIKPSTHRLDISTLPAGNPKIEVIVLGEAIAIFLVIFPPKNSDSFPQDNDFNFGIARRQCRNI
jgi:hypothetical protein